jgi:hypothetical protein
METLKIIKTTGNLPCYQVWRITSVSQTLVSSHATEGEAISKIAAIKLQQEHANWCAENDF